jgi:hypothetical protein
MWFLASFIFELKHQERNARFLKYREFEFGLEFGSDSEIGCEFKSKPLERKGDPQLCPDSV